MNQDYSRSIDRIIRKEFPYLNARRVKYVRHRICRYIRKFDDDNYGVKIGATPVSAGQYTKDDVIVVGNVKVYISILVD